MTIEKSLSDGILKLAPIGRLDTNTAPLLEAEIAVDGVTEIVFDLSRLEYISSAGLRIFLTTQKKMMACKGKVRLVSPNQMVRSVLEMTGCASIFAIE